MTLKEDQSNCPITIGVVVSSNKYLLLLLLDKYNHNNFIIYYKKNLIIVIYFFLGGLVLYGCKIGQSNILPTDENCYPYTNLKPEIVPKLANAELIIKIQIIVIIDVL